MMKGGTASKRVEFDERTMMATSPQNESALASQACRGDRRALRRLLLQQWSWMRAMVWGIVGDPHDADDVLQDVCVRVLSRIETLREPERFRPWLASVVRHEAISFRRRRKRRPGPLDPVRAEGIPAAGTASAEDQEDRRRLHEAIEALPPKYREVLMLQLTGHYSYADIAELLGVPVTTVQVRLVRARRMVHDHMMGIPVNRVPRT